MDGLAEKAAIALKDVRLRVPSSRGLDPKSADRVAALNRFVAGLHRTSGVYGRGILRITDYPVGNAANPRTIPKMRFFSFSTRTDKPADIRFAKYADRLIQSLNRELIDTGGLSTADAETIRAMPEGVAIEVIEPTGAVRPVGTIVYMPGLGSTTYEQPLIDELGRRGWWLVRIAPPRVWWYESKPWFIGSRADVEPTAEKLAGILDDLVAEPAYAAQAAMEYLAAHCPEIPLTPLVMVGCSAGALASPTVVARMPDKFDAAVLIGGGANLLEISQKSDLTNAGIVLDWPDNQPQGQWREQLFADYLRFSKLDPYHTARFLRDKPTLVVQANLDLTVPAHNGWLLWDRLGRPDRYDHVGEHRTLFLTLGSQSKRIADWLDDQMTHRPKHEPIVRVQPAPPSPTQSSGGGGSGSGKAGPVGNR